MANFFQKKIYSEKTLGERLKSLRRRKRLTLEKAEEETKVRLKYLLALEKGDYSHLPADVFAIGFLVKYIELLGGPKDELIMLYKRERSKVERPELFSPQTQFKERKIYLTPKIMFWGVLFLALAGLTGYIFYAVKNFTSPPNLAISSPVTESVIRQDKVEIIGKTDEGATLTINDQVVLIDDRGNFQEVAKLQPGLNSIEIKAVNRLKKETILILKVLGEF